MYTLFVNTDETGRVTMMVGGEWVINDRIYDYTYEVDHDTFDHMWNYRVEEGLLVKEDHDFPGMDRVEPFDTQMSAHTNE